MENLKNMQYSLEDELIRVQGQKAKVEKMANEMDDLRSSGSLSRMESYNNSKAELAFLNNILSTASEYDISFQDLQKDGDQIRRNFVLTFTADNYANAESIIKQLYKSQYRCLISDVVLQPSNASASDRDPVLNSDVVNVSLAATFYETMVDGEPDGALPEEEVEVTVEDTEE